MVAAKHHRHDLLNFYDTQNDADDITTLKICQNSELVSQVATDF